MLTQHITEYAECVLGFYLYNDLTVVMEEEITTTNESGAEIKFDKGSHAIVRSFTLAPLPKQLTIVLEIFDCNGRSTIQTFSEHDREPQFPFAPPKSQEQIEMERAEAAERAEKEKAEKEKKEREKQEAAERKVSQQQQQHHWQGGHGHHRHGRGFH